MKWLFDKDVVVTIPGALVTVVASGADIFSRKCSIGSTKFVGGVIILFP